MKSDLSALNALLDGIERKRAELNTEENEVISSLRTVAKSLGFELVPRLKRGYKSSKGYKPGRKGRGNKDNVISVPKATSQKKRNAYKRHYKERYYCPRPRCTWRSPGNVTGFKAVQFLGAHVSNTHTRRAA